MSNTRKDAKEAVLLSAYWHHLYKKADAARSRKEAIALINEAERIRNGSTPINEIIKRCD